jgi:hypothetical protein
MYPFIAEILHPRVASFPLIVAPPSTAAGAASCGHVGCVTFR